MSSHIVFILTAIAVTLIIVVGVFVVPGVSPFEDSNEVLTFQWEVPTILYFAKSDIDSDSCEEVFPVERIILNSETLGPGSFEQLIIGPNEEESSLGYQSFVMEGLEVRGFRVSEGVAYITLNVNPIRNENLCKQSLARNQIKRTLTELPDIDEVIIIAEEGELKI